MSLLDNLISYWKLDEASGNAIDAHGTNTLTAVNAPGSSAGKIGNARSFNGVNQAFNLTSNSSVQVSNQDFTFCYWVNFAGGTAQDCISKDDGGANREYICGRGFDLAMRFLLWNASGTLVQLSASTFGAVATGQWYFIANWHDATADTMHISVNGVENSAAITNGGRALSALFAIGNRGNLAAPTNGLIDEVGFWKRLLTPTERTALYNGGNGLSYDAFGGGGIIPILRQHYAAQGAR